MTDVKWTPANGGTATTSDSKIFVRASDGAIMIWDGHSLRAPDPTELTAAEAQITGLTAAVAALL